MINTIKKYKKELGVYLKRQDLVKAIELLADYPLIFTIIEIKKITRKLIICSRRLGLVKTIQLLYKLKSGNTNNIRIKNVAYPFSFRSVTSDISIFQRIFIYKEYDIDIDFNPKIIIDAGANIGLTTIFYANRYPTSKIISIEPEQSKYNLLKKNTQKYRNVITLNSALANLSNQDLTITDNDFKSKASNVKSISINEIINKYDYETIDIIKINIVGYEKKLFEKNTENWLPKTRCLIIELHGRINEGCSKSFFNIINKHDFKFSSKGEKLIFINNKLNTTNPKPSK